MVATVFGCNPKNWRDGTSAVMGIGELMSELKLGLTLKVYYYELLHECTFTEK